MRDSTAVKRQFVRTYCFWFHSWCGQFPIFHQLRPRLINLMWFFSATAAQHMPSMPSNGDGKHWILFSSCNRCECIMCFAFEWKSNCSSSCSVDRWCHVRTGASRFPLIFESIIFKEIFNEMFCAWFLTQTHRIASEQIRCIYRSFDVQCSVVSNECAFNANVKCSSLWQFT